MAKLGDVCNFYSGTGFPNAYQGDKHGKYPFYKVGDISKNVISGNVELISCDNYINDDVVNLIKGTIIPPQCVVFAKIGEALKLNRRALTSCYCLVDNNVMGVQANNLYLDSRYFYYFMCNVDLQRYSESTAVPSVRKSRIAEIEIPLPSLEEQRHIAAILDKVTDLIAQRRAQLDKLDLLVKSRFVEMFGDPEVNSFKLPSIPMTNLCEIIDGDRGPNYPKQEEFSSDGYCLFLNAKNVTNSGFCFNQCLYISKEKDSLMRKGKLQRGDIVLTTRGTIGNLAFYDNTIPYENVRINSGMVILRVHKEQITEIFFIEQFKMLLDLIKSKMASGSAQPQLPISTMKQIMMLVPPIEEQMNFNKIVVQTNTLKSRVTSSLDSLETLKKSLMQQYFE